MKDGRVVLTAQMQEIVNWWEEYGIKNWETDDVRPLFDELLFKVFQLPTYEEGRYLLNYLADKNVS